MAVESVSHGDHVDPCELQFREHREHQIIIAGQPRQIVDEHQVKKAASGGGEQSAAGGALPEIGRSPDGRGGAGSSILGAKHSGAQRARHPRTE